MRANSGPRFERLGLMKRITVRLSVSASSPQAQAIAQTPEKKAVETTTKQTAPESP